MGSFFHPFAPMGRLKLVSPAPLSNTFYMSLCDSGICFAFAISEEAQLKSSTWHSCLVTHQNVLNNVIGNGKRWHKHGHVAMCRIVQKLHDTVQNQFGGGSFLKARQLVQKSGRVGSCEMSQQPRAVASCRAARVAPTQWKSLSFTLQLLLSPRISIVLCF